MLMVNQLIGFGAHRASAPASTDPFFANVALLCGFEGVDGATTAVDESLSGHLLAFAGDAQIDVAQFKFGSSSMLFDGTGDRVFAGDSADWDFGAGQFSMKCFVRFASSFGTSKGFVGQWGGVSNNDQAWFLFLNSGSLTFRFRENSTTLHDTAAAWSPSQDTWCHVAADRDASNVVRAYLDGAMIVKATQNFAIQNGTGALGIGHVPGFGAFDLNGWLDEVRITKGVARYASDGGFTVPTAAYPRS